MAPRAVNRPKSQQGKLDELYSDLRITNGKSMRRLTASEISDLTAMLMTKERPEALDIMPLIPRGSFIQRMTHHFKDTDSSYALPLFQLIMSASSWLVQSGAVLEIPNLGPHRPILWNIALAPSGSSKTLATDRVSKILDGAGEEYAISTLPDSGSDAQWILDLKENNGSFWFQDEAGKYLNKVLTSSQFARMKPWILDAYSHKPISNRLKSEAKKLVLEDPHFTFFGLSVRETWKSDIDLSSMLDGLCQRFNYVIAEPRQDTDMFEHFLYFGTKSSAQKEETLKSLWAALCCQKNAKGVYSLAPETLPFLQKWWLDLRPAWGGGALPGSFIRRIGFSVFSYLVVIHFLLGLSNRPIGIETAEIATNYAEFHLESALVMIREYDSGNCSQIQTVMRQSERLIAKGNANPSARDISRNLSAKARQNLTSARIKEILDLLEKIRTASPQPLFPASPSISEQLFERHLALKSERNQQEEWRNRKRLAAVLQTHRALLQRSRSRSADVVAFPAGDDYRNEDPKNATGL